MDNFTSFIIGLIFGLIGIFFLKKDKKSSTSSELEELAEHSEEKVPKTDFKKIRKEVQDENKEKTPEEQAEDFTNLLHDTVDYLEHR